MFDLPQTGFKFVCQCAYVSFDGFYLLYTTSNLIEIIFTSALTQLVPRHTKQVHLETKLKTYGNQFKPNEKVNKPYQVAFRSESTLTVVKGTPPFENKLVRVLYG